MTHLSSRARLSTWERDFWNGFVRSFAFVPLISPKVSDVDLEGSFVTRQADRSYLKACYCL